ncbi:hypothetical protein ES708_26379 [subsurface metagenome]
MEIATKLGETLIGIIPSGLPCNLFPSNPNILATDGPCKSASNIPTLKPFPLKEQAKLIAIELFPTPPLLESTKILCFILAILFFSFSSRFLLVAIFSSLTCSEFCILLLVFSVISSPFSFLLNKINEPMVKLS